MSLLSIASLSWLCLLLSRATAYTVEDVSSAESGEFELVMPSAKPLEAETYLCTTIRLDENNTYYVTGFDPRAEMGTAHHMLLFGCDAPGQKEELFSCGEMGRRLEGTKRAAPCARGHQVPGPAGPLRQRGQDPALGRQVRGGSQILT